MTKETIFDAANDADDSLEGDEKLTSSLRFRSSFENESRSSLNLKL